MTTNNSPAVRSSCRQTNRPAASSPLVPKPSAPNTPTTQRRISRRQSQRLVSVHPASNRKTLSADNSPLKRKYEEDQENQTPQTQSANKKLRSASAKKPASAKKASTKTQNVTGQTSTQVKRWADTLLPTFTLKVALRLHWRGDVNEDEDAMIPDVWKCKFMPTLPGSNAHILATCGSHSVCFTDCDQGVVLMKYTHLDEPGEVFQALDWCLLESGEEATPVLAVGGRAKTIKLIHFKQEICYRYLKGHTQEIVDIKFLPVHQQLLSSSKDKRVLLWDIGEGFEPRDRGSILMMFDTQFPALYLAVHPSETRFMVSNTDCAIAEFELNPKQIESGAYKHRDNMVKAKTYYDGDGWHTSAVDSIHWMDANTMVSKGSGEDMAWVWDPVKSTADHPKISKRMHAVEYETYGHQGCAIGTEDQFVWMTGTPDGRLVCFKDVTSAKEAQAAEPAVTLSDEQSTMAIRSIDVSQDLTYIAATDSFDVTWIWSLQ